MAKRLFSRPGGDDLAQILEDALHREKIAFVVVDQEDARGFGFERVDHLGLRASLHTDFSHGAGHLYSAASIAGSSSAAATAAASRERATQTRTRASRSSMSTGFAI